MHENSPLGTLAIIFKVILFFAGFFVGMAWIIVTAMFSKVGKAISSPFNRRRKNGE